MGEDRVLGQEGGDLAATHPEEGNGLDDRLGVLERHLPVDPPAKRDRDAGRERLALPARRAHRVVELAIRPGRAKAIRAGTLVRGPAGGQVGRMADLVVDDGSAADGRADDPTAVAGQEVEEPVQLRTRQEPGLGRDGHHHGSSPCCENRSSSCMRVPERRIASASSSDR